MPQSEYDLGSLNTIVVTNRAGQLSRIMCYQLQILDAVGTALYSYPFATASLTFFFRNRFINFFLLCFLWSWFIFDFCYIFRRRC